jgi:hypothetical protein
MSKEQYELYDYQMVDDEFDGATNPEATTIECICFV